MSIIMEREAKKMTYFENKNIQTTQKRENNRIERQNIGRLPIVSYQSLLLYFEFYLVVVFLKSLLHPKFYIHRAITTINGGLNSVGVILLFFHCLCFQINFSTQQIYKKKNRQKKERKKEIKGRKGPTAATQ